MRRAACTRYSSQLRAMAVTAGAGDCAPGRCTATGAGAWAGGGDEQPVAAIAHTAANEPLAARILDSMQDTIDLLGQLTRDAVDAGQVVHACRGDAAHAAE